LTHPEARADDRITQRRRTEARLPSAAALALVLAASGVLGVGGAASWFAQGDDAPGTTPPSPMLEALSLLSPDIDAFEFTHWSALKAIHAGADVTSASPLSERQRLMLDIAHEETPTFPLGLDRLGTWSERWGWDTTDLEWQASCCGDPDFALLRFREG